MEDIVRIPLGCIIDIDIEENVEIGAGHYYFANMTETDIMEMYMSFIEEDWGGKISRFLKLMNIWICRPKIGDMICRVNRFSMKLLIDMRLM